MTTTRDNCTFSPFCDISIFSHYRHTLRIRPLQRT